MAFSFPKFNSDLLVLGNIFSNESAFQQPVLDIQTDATLDPGATPTTGDRYIIENSAALHANFGTITGVGDDDIVMYNGTGFEVVWDASANGEGAQTWDKDSNNFYQFDGTSWAQQTATVSTDATIDGDGSGGSPLSLADDAVTTAKILDANVTDAKIATGIDAAKLADGSVSNAELQFINSLSSNAQDQIDLKADLVAGKIPTAQLPALAITDVFTVADITARDALTIGPGDGEVQEGDVAIVTDASADANVASGTASYIYNGSAWSRLTEGVAVGSRSGALSIEVADWTSSLTQVVTHSWNTQDVQVEIYDETTGETCYSYVTRAANTVSITLNQIPANDLKVLLREVSSQTTLTNADG